MASEIVQRVAQRIREFRTSYGGGAGISQDALAKALGIAPNTISRWETGTYRPSLEDLEKLSRFFGKSVEDFVRDPNRNLDISPNEKETIGALVKTARQLEEHEIEELRRYAEFRRAERVRSRVPVGRKPKR